MLDAIFAEILDRGYSLHYLRQIGEVWEASITRPLAPRTDGNRYAVGYGVESSAPAALETALDRLEADFEILERPTGVNVDAPVAPKFDIFSLLKPPEQINPFRGRLL